MSRLECEKDFEFWYDMEEEVGQLRSCKAREIAKNPLNMREKEFETSHGLSKDDFRMILDILKEEAPNIQVKKRLRVSRELCLSCVIQFLRTNSYMRVVGDNRRILLSQAQVWR